jgi:hypothetical protein
MVPVIHSSEEIPVYTPLPVDSSPLAAYEGVEAFVADEVGETTQQESVDAPTDDRTHAEQIEVEKKDITEDPDLYAVRNFSL